MKDALPEVTEIEFRSPEYSLMWPDSSATETACPAFLELHDRTETPRAIRPGESANLDGSRMPSSGQLQVEVGVKTGGEMPGTFSSELSSYNNVKMNGGHEVRRMGF